MSSSDYPNPSVTDSASVSYEEVDTCLKICTEDGLRSRVYYNIASHPEYEIYTDGDMKYGLVAFTIFILHATGELPQIERMGSPMEDLTYNR